MDVSVAAAWVTAFTAAAAYMSCYFTDSDYGDAGSGACAWADVVGVFAKASVIASLQSEPWAPADNRMFAVADPGVASAEACQIFARNWAYDATDDCGGWTFDAQQSCYLKGPLACTPLFGTVVGHSAGLRQPAYRTATAFRTPGGATASQGENEMGARGTWGSRGRGGGSRGQHSSVARTV